MLGLAMQQSPDLAVAMNTFKRFFYLHAQAAAIELYADDKVFMAKYAVDLSAIDDLQQLIDLSIGHGRNIVRFLCGSTLASKVSILPTQPLRISSHTGKCSRPPCILMPSLMP